MAKIIPFKGVIYNAKKVGDLNKVMAPPYDVIPEKYQDELYSRHPNNVIRLILGKTSPADTAQDDRYTRAASDFKKWISDGILEKDEKPAIYYYTQTYTLKDGTKITRKGFMALSRLEEFGKGGIHPHEKTLSGPKADRLKLMQACGANFSCIFSLYSDPAHAIKAELEKAIGKNAPLIEAIDDDGIVNKVWRVEDSNVISTVAKMMENRALFIADGHHRYETALNFRRYMAEKTGSNAGDEPWNYVLMYFSNMDDDGMTIWPTHRVLHSLKGFEADKFLSECSKYFDVQEIKFDNASESKARKDFFSRIEKAGQERTSFGLYIKGKNAYVVLKLKAADTMDKVFGNTIPEVFKSLDVTVLHSLVLSKILGVTQESQEKQENLVYVKNSDEAINTANKEPNQLVFLLNPTKIEQVKAVAEAGFVMPQKSTYFYPKLLSGLVFNILVNDKETVKA